MTLTVPTAAQIAQSIERTARVVAPAIALVITCAGLLAEFAYDLGFQLGTAVHARPDLGQASARQGCTAAASSR